MNFKKCRKYYRKYTGILSKINNQEGIKKSDPLHEKGDFESICEAIENEIINQEKCM